MNAIRLIVDVFISSDGFGPGRYKSRNGGREGGNRILTRNPGNHEPDFVVEVPKAMNYVRVMPQTIEKRVEELEKQVAELSAQILGLQPRKKDWRPTVGSLADDELSREAERLGREYRQQQTYEKELAAS